MQLVAVDSLEEVDRVAREVDGVGTAARLAKAGGREDEAGALVARYVDAGDARDGEGLAADGGLDGLPGAEAVDGGPRTEVLGAVLGGEDAAAVEEPAAELVKVVRVVFVAEQDGVNDGQVGQRHGGALGVLERDTALFIRPCVAGRAEKGVGQEVDAIDAQDGRGGADVGNLDLALEAGRSHLGKWFGAKWYSFVSLRAWRKDR